MERELLYRFFSGESTLEEQTQVLDWLDAAPAHQAELIAQRRVFDAMLMLAPAPAVCRKASLFPLSRWGRESMRYAAAAVLALVVGGAYVSYRDAGRLQAISTISVPAGQRVDVVLPDGTKVCMNALSELKYPAIFASDSRKVQLSGEAFFDVAHDKKHPFIVETYAGAVEVLGTKFDVEARAASNEFSTSLVEGSVRVTDAADANNQVTLTPNQQVDLRQGRFVVSAIPAHEQFLWREGVIAFRDASFHELIREFERYYDVRIDVQRGEVTNKLFTGKIRISEGIDHALWVLQRSAEFEFVRNETKDVIYIR